MTTISILISIQPMSLKYFQSIANADQFQSVWCVEIEKKAKRTQSIRSNELELPLKW